MGTTAEVRRGTTTAPDGTVVAWALHGDPAAAGVPVVGLHGVTDSGDCWLPVLGAWLGEPPARAVLTVDARGHGATPLADGRLAMSDLARDAAAVVRDVLGRPVVAVGHSMGGLVAQELALSAPDLVVGLVLEDPAWRRDRDVDERGVLRWLPDAVASSATEDHAALLARSHRENAGWPEVEHAAWARARAALDPRLADGPHLWDERDWVEALRDVRVPVTLVVGDPARGAIVDEGIVHRVRELLGDRLTVARADAGHCVRREAPAPFQTAVADALATADRA